MQSCERRCRTILFVEDDVDIRESLRDALEMEGYEVRTAENVADAMDKTRNISRPCLVLLDLMMPVMNGLEFLSACQKDDALVTIPVVMVTAYDTLAREEATAARGILKKPIDMERLLSFVTQYCGPACAEVK